MVGSIFGNLLLFICLFSLFSLGMGKKEIIKTDAAPQSNLYSQAVRVGDLLFLSGSLGRDPKTGELKKGVVEQTWQSLENIGTILKAAGADFSDVVKCTVLLADIKDFAKMGEMYTQYFKVEPPARTCYQASALPAGADVEIECIAQVKKSKL